MKIVVLGGTGLIGSRLTRRLRADWHDVVVASPSTGVDAVTGEGLDVLTDAEVVFDVMNAPSWDDRAVLDFFETSSRRVLEAEGPGTWHHVALSVVGADRMSDIGYMRAKVAQETLIQQCGRPYSILRATQFFEFAPGIADASTQEGIVRLPSTQVQPVAADDVVGALAGLVADGPRNRIVGLAGPRRLPLHEFVAQALTALQDERPVVLDESAGYFNTPVGRDALVPEVDARVGDTTLAQWLDDAARGKG